MSLPIRPPVWHLTGIMSLRRFATRPPSPPIFRFSFRLRFARCFHTPKTKKKCSKSCSSTLAAFLPLLIPVWVHYMSAITPTPINLAVAATCSGFLLFLPSCKIIPPPPFPDNIPMTMLHNAARPLPQEPRFWEAAEALPSEEEEDAWFLAPSQNELGQRKASPPSTEPRPVPLPSYHNLAGHSGFLHNIVMQVRSTHAQRARFWPCWPKCNCYKTGIRALRRNRMCSVCCVTPLSPQYFGCCVS